MERNANAAGLASHQVPLVLSKISDAPVREIEQYVNRPTEARPKEIKKKQCHIPRPLNSFMLYRKAYQKLATQISGLSGHPMVSKIVGASWRHEMSDVKAKFVDFAEIEKDSHGQAFPAYRFRPRRPAQVKQKKKARLDVDKDNRSYIENAGDQDWEESSSKMQSTQSNKQLLQSKGCDLQGIQNYSTHGLRYHNDLQSIPDGADPLNLSLVPQHWQSQGAAFNELPEQPYLDVPYRDYANYGSFTLADDRSIPVPSHASGYLRAGTTHLVVDDFGLPIQHTPSDAGHFNLLASTEDPGFIGAFTQGEFDRLRSARLDAGCEDRRQILNGTMNLLEDHAGTIQHDNEQFAWL